MCVSWPLSPAAGAYPSGDCTGEAETAHSSTYGMPESLPAPVGMAQRAQGRGARRRSSAMCVSWPLNPVEGGFPSGDSTGEAGTTHSSILGMPESLPARVGMAEHSQGSTSGCNFVRSRSLGTAVHVVCTISDDTRERLALLEAPSSSSDDSLHSDSDESSSSFGSDAGEIAPERVGASACQVQFVASRRRSLETLGTALIPGAIIESTSSGNEYTLVRTIGQGAYGQVWLAKDPLQAERAVKIVPGIGAVALAPEIEKTRRASEMADSSHVPKFYEASGGKLHGQMHPDGKIPELLLIVMEFVDGPSAGQVAKQFCFPEIATKVVLHDIGEALSQLHQHGIIHRDIKGDNILISRSGNCYLCDFGVSKIAPRMPNERMTVCGTPFFMAPEVIKKGYYNEKVDIWSLGITAIELATGQTPWHKNPWAVASPHHVFHMLRALPPSPAVDRKSWAASLSGSGYSEEFQNFVAECLMEDPSARPCMSELLASPFLQMSAGDRQSLSEWLAEAWIDEAEVSQPV